ncbi:MAG TPA: hypothetical protein VM187_18735 [Niastella sp.]|nr:hypothetical protein [Niastella sp.]
MNDRWYRLNKSYFVNFVQNDVKNNALFTRKGHLIYTVSYGSAQDLPEALHSTVRQSYPDFNITHAVNVKESARNIWVVNLESLNRYVLVRLEEVETTLVAVIAGGILWGAAGMVLFIPFTALLKIIAEDVDSLRPLQVLLSREEID